MGPTISKALRAMASLTMAAALTVASTSADAQTPSQQGRDKGVYTPTIWVDPDGCEHWVMDDGAEGYMTPHTTRQGIPVCRRGDVCGVMEADQFFATDKYNISAQGRARLANFFQSTGAVSYIITGHTDSRASDAYNMRLSYNRANSVARVANQVGAKIADVRGYGERMPAVPNNSAANMAKNRRVEIICIR
ncbi:MAG: OmpA family protein [Sulfitobacter sp.]|nr:MULTISPECIES: OmpA family protein [Sulfitobacter]MBD82463.1 cell envelope biogenesis protein OmpA [Sulfitobacter sp.]WOI14773.1 OmpA family protein [Sulfitobacter sp. LC.270.F.C4]WPZ28565.1 OmpA family protein [Sulfitobacter sp. OXR-159]HAC48683.1 cell envelope biogenesis protein OmpA [Sulfitobacter sp.]HCQ58414.1 cell envelope biogenesis protein OmpA [Sulfitobacter sp.]